MNTLQLASPSDALLPKFPGVTVPSTPVEAEALELAQTIRVTLKRCNQDSLELAQRLAILKQQWDKTTWQTWLDANLPDVQGLIKHWFKVVQLVERCPDMVDKMMDWSVGALAALSKASDSLLQSILAGPKLTIRAIQQRIKRERQLIPCGSFIVTHQGHMGQVIQAPQIWHCPYQVKLLGTEGVVTLELMSCHLTPLPTLSDNPFHLTTPEDWQQVFEAFGVSDENQATLQAAAQEVAGQSLICWGHIAVALSQEGYESPLPESNDDASTHNPSTHPHSTHPANPFTQLVQDIQSLREELSRTVTDEVKDRLRQKLRQSQRQLLNATHSLVREVLPEREDWESWGEAEPYSGMEGNNWQEEKAALEERIKQLEFQVSHASHHPNNPVHSTDALTESLSPASTSPASTSPASTTPLTPGTIVRITHHHVESNVGKLGRFEGTEIVDNGLAAIEYGIVTIGVGSPYQIPIRVRDWQKHLIKSDFSVEELTQINQIQQLLEAKEQLESSVTYWRKQAEEQEHTLKTLHHGYSSLAIAEELGVAMLDALTTSEINQMIAAGKHSLQELGNYLKSLIQQPAF